MNDEACARNDDRARGDGAWRCGWFCGEAPGNPARPMGTVAPDPTNAKEGLRVRPPPAFTLVRRRGESMC